MRGSIYKSSKMGILAMPFVPRLKVFLSILLMSASIGIMMLLIYLDRHPLYVPLSTILSSIKASPNGIYSGYFNHNVTRKNVSFVVIVLSATDKSQRRELIRQTWWKDCQKYEEIVCRFMIDTLNNTKDTLNNTKDTYSVEQEVSKTRDVIVSPISKGLLFGHRILYAMEWSLHYYNFDYLIRVDDDVLLCMEHIMHRHKRIPRTSFMSGVLHCSGHGAVHIDEGIVTFSQDIVKVFLSQDPYSMYCHTFGDQTYSTWINDLRMNPNEFYYIETLIHHDPPASRVAKLKKETRICSRYIALHGVYGDDMKLFWNRRGQNVFRSETGLMKVDELCPYLPSYAWSKFSGVYKFKPKLCNDPTAWRSAGEANFGREQNIIS